MKNPCASMKSDVEILKRMLTLASKRKIWWVGADESSENLTIDYPAALCISPSCTLDPQALQCPVKERSGMYAAAAHISVSTRRAKLTLEILCDEPKTFSYNHKSDKRRKNDLSHFPAKLVLNLKQPLNPLRLWAEGPEGTTAELKVFPRENFSLGHWMVSVKVTREEYFPRDNKWVEVEIPTEFSVVGKPTS